MSSRITRRELLHGAASVAAASLLEGCHAGSPPHSAPGINVSGDDSLRFHAASAGLLYGCAVDPKVLLQDAEYAHLIRQQCSIIVPENCMKWDAVEWERDHPRFDDADALVAFAEKNHIKMRGHTLVWHEALPPWLEKTITPQNANALLVSRIQTVCSRYSGRIHSWDVVNEAIEPHSGRPDGLRNSIWLRNIGPDYIEIAFRTARAADPGALLTYNDYNLEDDSNEHEERRRVLLTMMRRFRARNVPIDAVGIQAHLYAPDAKGYGSGLRRFIAALRELDLQVFITEMDVNDSKLPNGEAGRNREVGHTVTSFLDTALGNPAVHAVLTWGITSRYAWLTQRYRNAETRGLPFDDNLQPTGMFAAIRDSFDRRHPAPQKVQSRSLPRLR